MLCAWVCTVSDVKEKAPVAVRGFLFEVLLMHLHSIFYAFASIESPEGGSEAVRHDPGFVGGLQFGAEIGDLGGVQQRER